MALEDQAAASGEGHVLLPLGQEVEGQEGENREGWPFFMTCSSVEQCQESKKSSLWGRLDLPHA